MLYYTYTNMFSKHRLPAVLTNQSIDPTIDLGFM